MKCKQQATEQKKKIYIKELLETAADKLHMKYHTKYHMKAYSQISADTSSERKKSKHESTVQCAYWNETTVQLVQSALLSPFPAPSSPAGREPKMKVG